MWYPARIIGKRFPNKIAEELIKLRWWHLNRKQFHQIGFMFEEHLGRDLEDNTIKIIKQVRGGMLHNDSNKDNPT